MIIAGLESHPAADIFPMMSGLELDELVEDVRANGLGEPILLLDGKVLDGRNRLRACEIAEVEPRFAEYEGDVDDATLLVYVKSRNLHRRHLTPSQRAAAAAAALPVYAKAARKRRAHGKTAPGRNAPGNRSGSVDARDEVGADFGVSGRMVSDAKKLADVAPALAARVKKGELTVAAAKKLLREEGAAHNTKSVSTKAAPAPTAPTAPTARPSKNPKVAALDEKIITYYRGTGGGSPGATALALGVKSGRVQAALRRAGLNRAALTDGNPLKGAVESAEAHAFSWRSLAEDAPWRASATPEQRRALAAKITDAMEAGALLVRALSEPDA